MSRTEPNSPLVQHSIFNTGLPLNLYNRLLLLGKATHNMAQVSPTADNQQAQQLVHGLIDSTRAIAKAQVTHVSNPSVSVTPDEMIPTSPRSRTF